MGLLTPLNKVRKHYLTTLYGNNGVGKTSVINSLPGRVLIIDTDNGLESIDSLGDDSAVAQCTNYADVLEALTYVDDFDSIAVDTFDKIQELAIKQAMTKAGKVYGKDLTEIGHYGTATSMLLPLIDELVEIAKQGKNVLVLVHDKEISDEDKEKQAFTHASIRVALMPKVGQQLCAQSRIIGYLHKDFKDTYVKGKKHTEEVYRGTFGGNAYLTTKVTRSSKIKAPNIITNVTWDKIQALITGIKPGSREEVKEEETKGEE